MRYEPDPPCLRFGTREEAERFHAELTDLVRLATVEAGRGAPDAAAAKEQSREVFKRYALALRALNAFRVQLTPSSRRDDP